MAQKIFYYIVTSTKIEENYDTFVSFNKYEDSFSDEKILLTNLRKTITKENDETCSFEDKFCDFGNTIVDVLTTLFLIKYQNIAIHNTIYLYYNSEKKINCISFHLSRWCLTENSNYSITISDAEINSLLMTIRKDITKTNVANIQRKLAVLTNFYYADNIHDENRIIDQFLLYWSSFNALYRTFRITYIAPIIKELQKEIDKNTCPIIQWGDVAEVTLARQAFEYDDCTSIYELRNSIIHGNRIIPFYCSDAPSALKSMALYYSNIIRDIIFRNYLCCFEMWDQRDFKETLCQTCIDFLEARFRNKEFKDCSQAEIDEQIQNYHNQIYDNYRRMQTEWDE